MREKVFKDAILWFFLALFIVSFFLLGKLLWPFISIIVMGMVVAGVFNPVYNLIKVDGKIGPNFASMLTCTIIFLVLFVPIVLFVSVLSKEAYDLYISAKNAAFTARIMQFLADSSVIDKINPWLANFNFQVTGEELNKAISEIARVVGLFLYTQARTIASNTLAFLFNFFMMLLIVFFLLVDGAKLTAFIIDLSPLPAEQDTKLIEKFKDMCAAVLVGNGIGGGIQGLLGGFLFAFFGFKSPFLWGVIMGLLAFLPIVGIAIVFIPAAAYLYFIEARLGAAIFFVVFYLVLSNSVEYFLKPKLVGSRAKIHTLLVFLSIIGGLRLFGILGIIYGPLIVTAFLTLTDIYRTNYQQLVDPC